MVFDDIAGVIPTGNPIYTKLATTCRHYNTSVFFHPGHERVPWYRLSKAMSDERRVFHTDDEATVDGIYREKMGMAFDGRYQDFKR